MPARSLTREEAERRAALLAVERYDVEVDLTALPSGPEVRAVSTVVFTCREQGAETFVDCAADVVEATLDGASLPPAVDGRIALSGLGGRHVLRVASVQADTATGPGVHRAVDGADGEVYLWTSFEPDEARYVWACFDQPDLKAPHAFTVTAPPSWQVLSNSGSPQVEDLGDARRWTFADTPPLATYNTVVNGGPFVELRREAGGFDLGLYARRSLAAALERDADEVFRVTEQGLAFFGEVFALPFPQRTYDQVFVPEFGGAMENYGCVTWDDTFLRRTPPTPAERELLVRVLLHEMAHMWFGNVVTMRWWDDLWLNEAFAEFAAHWAATRATEHTDVWATHLAGEELRAYLADAGPESHPIRQPVRDVAQAASIFDAITYPKGASSLAQLMAYVGEEEFCAGMATYFAEHAWGSTTLQDLVDALAAASGRDLEAWREGWLDTAGTDRLVLEREGDAHVLLARGPQGPPRPHVLAVGSYVREGDRLTRVGRVLVEVQGERTPLSLPEADLHLVNDDDLTFATVRPPAGSERALLEAAPLLPTPLSRGVAVAAAWDMLLSGEATAPDVVGCLTGVLRAETAPSVVEPYLLLAGDAAELWSPDADRARLCRQVADTCTDLAQDPVRRAALRTLARTAVDLQQVATLRDAAGDDLDLQWRALVKAAELGAGTDDDVARLLARDDDPEVEVRVLTVRAASPRARDKEAVWQRLVVDRAVPIGWVRDVAAAFWRPGQDDVLRPYGERYVALLPELARGGMNPAMVYTARLLPPFAVDEDLLQRAGTAAEQAPPVVGKTFRERADLVRRMLRARGQAT